MLPGLEHGALRQQHGYRGLQQNASGRKPLTLYELPLDYFSKKTCKLQSTHMRQTERTVSTFLNGLQLISQIIENDKTHNIPGINTLFQCFKKHFKGCFKNPLKKKKENADLKSIAYKVNAFTNSNFPFEILLLSTHLQEYPM